MTAAGRTAFDALTVGAEIQRRIGVKTSRDEPLARFTTMRVGGRADLFATVHNAFELRGLVRFARSRAIPHLLLGRGSNVVISDHGVRGLVIQVRAEGHRIEGTTFVAEAGVAMARAATETAGAGLSGLEFGLAIPGTVGGAVWANAGAHGEEVADVLESADILLADGREARLTGSELHFSYRDSRFKHIATAAADGDASAASPDAGVAGDPDARAAGESDASAPHPAEVVVAARFGLRERDVAEIKGRLDEIRRWRREHQPLGLASAGSVFRNPPDGPSAGELIDRAGLKGRRIGGAVVSEKHANFIVNDQHGRAADVRRLAEVVRSEIERRDGVRLEMEVEFVGDWEGWPWPDEETKA